MDAPLQQEARIAAAPRSMGDLLVDCGKLQPAQLSAILECQAQTGLPFGEAAISLNLLTQSDIDQTLRQQFDYAYLDSSDARLAPQLICAYKPFSRVGEDLRAMRSQLMLRWFHKDRRHKFLSIVSPAAGEGRSFIAANLAVVFAQQGERTLLIEADLRAKPESSQQALFKLQRNAGLSGILAGRVGVEVIQKVDALSNLHVLSAGAVPPNPQELLGRRNFTALLSELAGQYDVILIDTPNCTDYADAELIAANAGAALLVTRVHQSQLKVARRCVQRFQDSGIAVVGALLNHV
jgi:protein-tyrosine kinase